MNHLLAFVPEGWLLLADSVTSVKPASVETVVSRLHLVDGLMVDYCWVMIVSVTFQTVG
jgi:hypothetical protein